MIEQLEDRTTPTAEISYYPSATESMPEGDPGSYFLLFRSDTTGPLTVNLSYAGTATFGSDYTAPTTATFQDGFDTSDPIPISTIEDATPEGDESIILTVEPGTGYTVGSPASGTGMILEDDEPPPTPTVEVYNDLDTTEGGSDGDFAIFVSGAEPFADVTVSFTLTGTAADPDDYTPSKTVSVTVTTDEFGDASTDVFITARPDNFVDPDETVSLTISDDPGYTITAGSATMTITDDPARVAIGPDTQDVDEGWQGGLTLSRSGGDLNQSLTVLFSLGTNGYGDQTAVYIDDFALTEPSLSDLDNGLFEVTFPAGFTAVYVGVPVVDDNMQEETEGFRATVVAPDGWPYLSGDETDGSKWAEVRIIDAPTPILEGEVAVSISESQVIEGGTAEVTFRRQGTDGTLRVYFDLSGSATLGEDYNAIGETDATGRFVEIADGATSVTVPLTTLDDTLLEGTAHLFVSVLPGSGYNPADAEGAVLPILDNEMGTIGGIAWLDDGDGIRQDTEGAAAGAPVALLDGGTAAFRQTTTGTDGAYQFDDVPAGTYSVWFGQAVSGKREYTLAKQGTDITRDSDVDQSNGISDMITLSVDTTEDLSVGAGFLVLDLSPPPPPDTPPTISSVDDRQIVPGGTTGEIAFTVGDAETPADDLVVTATLLNLPNDSTGPVQVVTGGTGSNRTVTVTGAPGWSGLAAVQLGVTDAGGALMATAFNVVVQQANNPPTFVDSTGVPTNKYTATIGIHAPKGGTGFKYPGVRP